MEFHNIRSETSYFNFESKLSFLDWLYAYLVLPFNMEHQTQSNWCWAATSKSVSYFYSVFSPWTQYKIASAELSNTCCTTPVPPACNVPWYLEKALTRTNQFAANYQGRGSWTHTYFTKKYFYFMWFKDLQFLPDLLKPIPEIRPLINIYDKKIEENIPGVYSIPHYAYIVGLHEIRDGFILPSSPKTLRLIELQNETPISLFELGVNETDPGLVQVNVSEMYFNQPDEGLSK